MGLNIPQTRQHAMMEAIEKRFARDMKREIASTSKAMVAGTTQDGHVPEDPDHRARIAQIVGRYVEVTIRVFGIAILDGSKSMVAERKDFAGTMSKIALRYIMQEAMRRRITSIADTTRANIVDATLAGYAAGLGQRGVAEAILAALPSLSDYRANLIARTETHGAANYGSVEAAKETGVDLRKEWISAEDDRTRDSHRDANGQTVGPNDAFTVGGEELQYPGDPAGSAENVCNCRCTTGFVVAD